MASSQPPDPGPWARSPRPALPADARTLGRWNPARAADITAGRLQLCAALHEGVRPPSVTEAGVEQLVLVFEELVSNGVRHGRRPIEVVVTATGDCWVLEVFDAAGGTMPTPDPERDPALGGLGLALVALVSAARGWEPLADGRKVVWARVDYASQEHLGPGPDPRRHGQCDVDASPV